MRMPTLELLDGVAQVPPAAWNALVGDESPFLEWEWLASLEDAGAVGAEQGWLPRPLVARDGERLLAACPVYVKTHSEGEFVFDFAWADAAARAGIRYYPKLLVGVPFTPVTGARFLVAPGEDRPAWTRRIAEALQELCHAHGFSGVHVNFCREEELPAFAGSSYLPRVGIQYHWRNAGYASFEDYLASLRSKRRNQVRRERAHVREQGIRIEACSGAEIPDSLFAAMYRCYRSTVDQHVYGRRYLNARFFELLRERYRERLCFLVARRGEEIVAGTTNVFKGNTFYGRYWGALDPLRHLHFDVCYYAAIEWCIERGIECFEPGAGGEQKLLRGFDPQPTWSLHLLTEPRLARAVARHLEAVGEEAGRALGALRGASAVKTTRNADRP
jgi:predicted N-acyltransferase